MKQDASTPSRAPARRRIADIVLGAALLAGAPALPGCMMRETVRDSHGNIIYQETVRGTPFDSEHERNERILTREQELGR